MHKVVFVVKGKRQVEIFSGTKRKSPGSGAESRNYDRHTVQW